MKQNILESINHRSGETVPEGYFADFKARMKTQLPDLPREAAEPAPKRSLWTKIRPYAYLAAMFAGIWCMMNMFDIARSASGTDTIEEHPRLIAALSDDSFVNEYVMPDIDGYDLYNDLYESGFDPSEFDAE